MELYLIKEHLTKADKQECLKHEFPYVAITTKEEFVAESRFFDMGIDMDLENEDFGMTQIEVNYDSYTGFLSIPNRSNIFGERSEFLFALDEKGIAIIDDNGNAAGIIDKIIKTRKWRNPSLERFIYDFLERIVENDLKMFEEYDKCLDEMENRILTDEDNDILEKLVDIRGEMLELHGHYEQLIDISQELEENENNFFKAENLRFFSMYTKRVERLNDITNTMRDRVMQIRDLYDSHLEIRQNKISTLLTIVATIFMPLTLIVGWYGMNFKYMPELDETWSYPIVIAVCIIIVIGSIIFFKKKKWL